MALPLLPLSQLLPLHATLSLIIAPFTGTGVYNLTLALFGIYADGRLDDAGSLKLFTFLFSLSIPLDVLSLIRHSTSLITLLLSIGNLLLKPITLLSLLTALSQRGESSSLPDHLRAQFQSLAGRRGGGGETVWSMPGGYGSGAGGAGAYESVGEAEEEPNRQQQGQGQQGGYNAV